MTWQITGCINLCKSNGDGDYNLVWWYANINEASTSQDSSSLHGVNQQQDGHIEKTEQQSTIHTNLESTKSEWNWMVTCNEIDTSNCHWLESSRWEIKFILNDSDDSKRSWRAEKRNYYGKYMTWKYYRLNFCHAGRSSQWTTEVTKSDKITKTIHEYPDIHPKMETSINDRPESTTDRPKMMIIMNDNNNFLWLT